MKTRFIRSFTRYTGLLLLCWFAGSQLAFSQYCSISFTGYSTCVGGNITDVQFAGINHSIACVPGGGYMDFTTTVAPARVMQGTSYPVSLSIGGLSYTGGAAIWIDFNKNGTFESTEQVFSSPSAGSHLHTGTINIPASVSSGITTMRIVGTESSTPTSPCGSQTYGEAHDYRIMVGGGGANNAGIASIVSPANLSFCAGNQDISVKVTNNGSNKINYLNIEWAVDGVAQSTFSWSSPIDTAGSTDGNDTVITIGNIPFNAGIARTISVWTSMPNGVADTSTYDDSATVTVQAKLNCATLPSYCSPTFNTWSTCIGGAVASVSFAGITNSVPCLVGGGYRSFTNTILAPVVLAGVNYPISVRIGSSYPVGGGTVVWIDYNRNGVLESTEEVFSGIYNGSNPTPYTYTGSVTIPSNATSGYTLMRVAGRESTAVPTACSIGYGEVHDYMIYIGGSAPNNASVKAIEPATLSFCAGMQDIKARIKNSGSNMINNVTVEWSVNGVAQMPVYWSGSLDTLGGPGANDTLITLGSLLFNASTSQSIKVWTSLPNGVNDTMNIDDTLNVSLVASTGRMCMGLPTHCTPVFTTYSSCVGGAITNVTFAGINNTVSCVSGGSGYYRDFAGLIPAASVAQGQPYPFSATIGTSSLKGGVAVWIDYNMNGVFEASEQVYTGAYSGGSVFNGIITIPTATTSGYTIMRVVGRESSTPTNPCGAGYGEAHDYVIFIREKAYNNAGVKNIQPQNASFCQGLHDVKALISNNGRNLISSLTVEWSVDGVGQTPVPLGAPLDTSGSGTSEFLLNLGQVNFTSNVLTTIKVWTSNPNGVTDTATYDDTLTVTIQPSVTGPCAAIVVPTYCVPSFISWTTSCVGGAITNVQLAGINHNEVCAAIGTGYYKDLKGSVAPAFVSPGKAYPVSITIGGSYTGSGAIWIDLNKDGFFDASEQLFAGVYTGVAPQTYTGNITIPHTALSGYTVMRVMGVENSTPLPGEACTINAYYGEAQDYLVYISDRPYDNAALTKKVAPLQFCAGYQDIVVRVANYGKNVINNVYVNWSVNNALQSPVYWPNPIDTLGSANGSDTAITLGNILFTQGVAQQIKVWTSNPNGVADTSNTDDTLSFTLKPALNGLYTIGATGDFTTFNAAANELSAVGTCGPVTFNVAAGTTFNESPITISNVGSATDTILFVKTGAGANPVIQGTSGTGAADAVITLKGVRYLTFDGIDVKDNASNTTTASQMEYGFMITNLSNRRGSSHNHIKNSRITLKRTNTSSVGLLQVAAPPASPAMANSFNRYTNIRVENAYHGIDLLGNNLFPDTGCVVTSEGTDTTVIGANVANDIGNGSASVYGIYCNNQVDGEVSKCLVRNLTHTSTGTAQGILVENVSNAAYGNFKVFNNIIHNINRTNTSTSTATHVHGIRLELSVLAAATVYNNVVYNITSTGNTSSANAGIAIRGITVGSSNGTGTAFIYNNSVQIANTSLNRSSTAFWKGGSGTVSLKNNVFSNITATQTGVAKHYALYRSAGVVEGVNNLLWSANGNGFTGYYGSDRQTIYDWRTASGQDLHSVSYRPALKSGTHLSPDVNDSAVWAMNGRAAHLAEVTKDVLNVNRAATVANGTPDIGAYEFLPYSVPPVARAVPQVPVAGGIQSFLFAEDTIGFISWDPGSAIPSEVKVRIYSGEVPGLGLQDHQILNCYWSVDMTPGSYVYTTSFYYRNIWRGTMGVLDDLKMIRKTPSSPWVPDYSGITDTPNYKLTSSFITDPSLFLSGAYQYDVLPVKLLSLSAQIVKKDVMIKWITTSELNTNRFEVERSEGDSKWLTIGEVKASGNSQVLRNYQLPDHSPFNRTRKLYYRLKISDHDGSYTYSPIVTVQQGDQPNNTVAVYPNPFSERVYIKTDLAAAGSVKVTLMDLSGRIVHAQQADAAEGVSMMELEGTDKLQSGIYFVRTEINGVVQTQKLLKQ